MSDDFEDVFDSLGNSKIKVHIEKRILDIIHKGNASDDLISRRPIRELILMQMVFVEEPMMLFQQ